MDVVALTRQLVDIESITGNEGPVGDFLCGELNRLGYEAKKMRVEGERCNVYATTPQQPQPAIVFSTHMDTVPPFIRSSEDENRIYGRGSCDAKGIIAAQIAAAETLRRESIHVGLLFLVGEERDSLGAKVANQQPVGCKFLINGEPTENRIAIASKGALRVELTAHGRMAHSAYPELGESAIDKLLDALMVLRGVALPEDPVLGRTHYTVGLIEGGVAPNVVSPHASAEILFRIVGEGAPVRAVLGVIEPLVSVDHVLDIPAVRMHTLPGFETAVFPYTTDVLLLTRWGTPLLLGPGSIHVAHTDDEHVSIDELNHAVELYERIARQLLIN